MARRFLILVCLAVLPQFAFAAEPVPPFLPVRM